MVFHLYIYRNITFFCPCFLLYLLLSIQAEGKARVGVRLLGHLLRGASVRGGVQMEIIEIPLSKRPVAVACCPVTGDLLVGCEDTLVLFALRRQNQQSLVRVQLIICGFISSEDPFLLIERALHRLDYYSIESPTGA